MNRINLLHYVLLGMPVVLFFLSLILVMGQGKKDFMGMIKRGAGRMKRKLALVLCFAFVWGSMDRSGAAAGGDAEHCGDRL